MALGYSSSSGLTSSLEVASSAAEGVVEASFSMMEGVPLATMVASLWLGVGRFAKNLMAARVGARDLQQMFR